MAVRTVVDRGVPTAAPPIVEENVTPVKWWAVAGGVFIALQLYIYLAWIISGDAVPTPVGPDAVPLGMKVAAIFVQVLCPTALAFLGWRTIVVPLRREGRVSFDGVLLLALLTVIWQDPLSLYTQAWGSYNAYLTNFGCWATHIPGWLAPNVNHLAEPTWFLFGYSSIVLPVGMVLCWFMRTAKRRWPNISNVRLIAGCFLAGWVTDLLLEGAFALTGLYNFGGVWGPKLFAGHFYAFPLIEAPLMGSFFAMIAVLRYFRDDKGDSFAERGATELRVSRGRATGIRFLALAGAVNILFLATYNIPFQWLGAHNSAWPKDVTSRSYFNYLCDGPGTGYACSGPGVPIPRPDSAHIGEDGKTLVPGHH